MRDYNRDPGLAAALVGGRGSAMNNSFEAVAVGDSVGTSLNRSPSLRKNKVIGLMKPNNLDPTKLPYDDGKIAGVGTNYGLSP